MDSPDLFQHPLQRRSGMAEDLTLAAESLCLWLLEHFCFGLSLVVVLGWWFGDSYLNFGSDFCSQSRILCSSCCSSSQCWWYLNEEKWKAWKYEIITFFWCFPSFERKFSPSCSWPRGILCVILNCDGSQHSCSWLNDLSWSWDMLFGWNTFSVPAKKRLLTIILTGP